MAVSVRSVRLSNSGKRRTIKRRAISAKRKNPSTKKRKLSPKQIAIFGTARQKAALRSSKARKRNAGVYSNRKSKKAAIKRGVSGPVYHRYVKAKLKAKRAKKRNVGEIVSIALSGLNPGKKRNSGTMATRRRRRARRNSGTVYGRSFSRTKISKRKRKNPGVRRRRRTVRASAPVRRRRRTARRANPMFRVRRVRRIGRRRNAGISSVFSGGIIMKAAGVIGGAVATRYLTQMALGGNNTGYVGYLGNAVTAWALSWATKKVLKNNDLGNNVLLGGLVSTVLRIIQDKTPYGQYVTSALSGMGKGGDVGIGIIQDSSFSIPQVNNAGSMTSFITPRATRDYVGSQVGQVAATRAAMTKGVAGIGSGRRRAIV